MNKAIKELYNKMNDEELFHQIIYLSIYIIEHGNELDYKELKAIRHQKEYIWRLRKSLKLVGAKND